MIRRAVSVNRSNMIEPVRWALPDHRPTRTRHPDAVALDGGVQLAAVFVLEDESLESGAEVET
jgi:hypothetical protein